LVGYSGKLLVYVAMFRFFFFFFDTSVLVKQANLVTIYAFLKFILLYCVFEYYICLVFIFSSAVHQYHFKK